MPSRRYISLLLLTGSLICTVNFSAPAQTCPPNIDFEEGTFFGWTCYTGTVASVGGTNVITFNVFGEPIFNRHTMYTNPGGGLDPYGHFPVNCPNGSGHSIRLGNNEAGTESEGVSYDFTIPADADFYNLIYHYAVVFQDPGHLPSEQPRMEIEIRNITTGELITCSSFTFFPIGSPLPGFELSDSPNGNTPVWFKKWSAVSINLDGLAGNNIRLFFKTADCTFRRHFGYAYIDVNTGCSDRFQGADFCPDDTAVNVTAPYGYQTYTWYDTAFTTVLGNNQTLSFSPPPPAGTSVAVVLIPYDGYGCIDTLYTDLTDTLKYKAETGPGRTLCNGNTAQIGAPPRIGWNYQWFPPTGLSNPNVSNPVANPDTTTMYYLSIRHDGGGCFSMDSVLIKTSKLSNTLQVIGSPSWCIGSGDSTILKVPPCDSIQWFKDNVPIPGANQPVYRVTVTGAYYAKVFSFAGCVLNTVEQEVTIASIPVAGFTVNNNVQCLVNNKFVFTNNSTNAVGAMKYKWILGDGFMAYTRNLTYSYKAAGTYTVVMIVSSSDVCADSTTLTVTVHPNVAAEFAVNPVCINMPVQAINNTIDPGNTPVYYLWNFGNGQTSTLRNPPPQVYSSAGNYVMSLSVSSGQCPLPLSIQKRFVFVEAPRPGINNPAEIAVVNLPLTLQARPFGNSVLWTPATGLNDPTSYTPTFISNKEQQYTIEIKTAAGCITVDTQLVKINKSIEIYVPNSFTPNSDGKNDVLRPFMIGIKQLSFFRIYNRWGQLIFETHDAKKGWDGIYKGTPYEVQTLVWALEGIGVDNKVYKAKGSTVLIR